MKLWVLMNRAHNVSEDTCYLVGRIAARFDEIQISHVADDAVEAPIPPGPADAILSRLRNRSEPLHLSIDATADELGVPVSNPGWAALRSNDKRWLIEDFPDLIPPSRVVDSPDTFRDTFNDLGGDVVVKAPFGRHGEQVRRIRSLDEMSLVEALFDEWLADELVISRFMSGFADGDRRILTVRGAAGRPEAVAGIRRIPPPGGWICNLSSGGRAVIEDPSDEEAAIAVEVAERAGLDIAQLDFGWHEGRCYLIETNQQGGGFIDYDIGHRANCADAVARWMERLARGGRST